MCDLDRIKFKMLCGFFFSFHMSLIWVTNLFLHFLAAKGKGKGMMKEELKGPEVCKDPVRLASHAVGVNIFKQGEDPKLKPPEEYPEWWECTLC